MSEIRMRAVHPACTVSAEEAHRLALGVLDAIRALRSAFSERHPSWIRSEDGTWYVVIMAADRFDDWRRAAAPPVHVPGPGLTGGCHLVETSAEMLAHLEEHRAAGDDVPEECLDELRADAEANDQRAAELRPTRSRDNADPPGVA